MGEGLLKRRYAVRRTNLSLSKNSVDVSCGQERPHLVEQNHPVASFFEDTQTPKGSSSNGETGHAVATSCQNGSRGTGGLRSGSVGCSSRGLCISNVG